MYKPKNFKYKKLQRGRLKNCYQLSINKIYDFKHGTFALKSLELGEIQPNQIESVRKILSKEIKKYGKIWIKIFSTIIRTAKPAEVRMGKGKGSLKYWAAGVKSGQILFEISNIDYNIAKSIFKKAANKLPVLTKFVINK